MRESTKTRVRVFQAAIISALTTIVTVDAHSAPFRRGDANGDGSVDISDSVYTLLFLFQGQGAISCSDAADSNDDGKVNIADSILILFFLFTGGDSIQAPGPQDCGLDPTEDALTCASYGAACPGGPTGGPVGVSTRLTFATTDQGLFGPDATVNRNVYLIKSFFDREIGPVTEGRILENVDQDVPLEVLQAAWDRAMATCMSQCYSRQVHSSCENVTVCPTQSECETGFIGTRTITLTCCVSPTDDWSNGCFLNGKDRRSYTRTLNINLGRGIGPRPTQPTPRPFDVGMVMTYETAVDVGLEAEFVSGAGSVNLDYSTVATLEASKRAVPAGEVFTLTARHVPDPGAIHMESDYPQLAGILRYYIDARTKLDADYAYMNPNTGEQVRTQTTAFQFNTGRLTGELVAVEIGLNGLELRLMNNVPNAPERVRDVVWLIPPSIEFVFTNPFGCPLNIPVLPGTKLCPWPIPPVSTDVFTIKFQAPQLDTPAVPDFDGGVVAFGSTTPKSPERNKVAADGSVTNTTPSGFRPLFNLKDGLSLDDFVVDETTLSTDYARLDWDIDGTLSLLTGFFGAGVNFRVAKVFDVEFNVLDLDILAWFHLDQTLTFRPNLMADLQFDRPVRVRAAPWLQWVEVSRWTLPVKADVPAPLEIVQPEGGVTITPTFSLRDNRFTNSTDMLFTFGTQETHLQVKPEGVLFQVLAAAALPFNPNFALVQATQAHEPISIGRSSGTWPLDGFKDLPSDPLSIGIPAR